MIRDHPQRTIARIAVLCAALVTFPFAVIALASPQAIGIAAAVVRNVDIRGSGKPQFRKVVVRQRVVLGDLVRTGANSRLQIVLLDKSSVNVGANALLSICSPSAPMAQI
jgi:hypothetical protein